MDDLVIIHQDKEYLKYALFKVECILNKYKLDINKTKIISSIENIDFLGYVFSIHNNKVIMELRRMTKRKFKKKVKICKLLLNSD